MFMKLIVSLCLIAAVSSDCDNVKCAGGQKHYRELGCTPVKENNKCCPARFVCPDKAHFALDKCYWKGKGINIGDSIPTEETSPLCAPSCYCAEGYPKGRPAEFRCAQIDCPHFFNPELVNCTKKSTLESCCPEYLCTEEEKKTLGTATCEVDGKTYRSGESIYPKSESCYSCVCGEHFDNSTIVGNPACREINCGVELRNLNDYRDGCIPIYFGISGCCPIGWRCPEDTDIMVSSEIGQCQFGKLTLHVGDEIKSADACEVCKCITPPMVHCVKTPNC